MVRGWVAHVLIAAMVTITAACSSEGAAPPDFFAPLPRQDLSAGEGASADASGLPATPSPSAAMRFQEAYRLGVGDKLRIIVFGEPDLSGEFEVDSTGVISLPLIGEVRAHGQTLRELEKNVQAKLREGYLRDPRVSAEVINFRPFTIIGEVNEPGEYPYRSGMSVLNAVAAAKGYTYRANTDRVYITRTGSSAEVPMPATNDVQVMPGDIIRIPERFF